jgi:hypothetical protein
MLKADQPSTRQRKTAFNTNQGGILYGNDRQQVFNAPSGDQPIGSGPTGTPAPPPAPIRPANTSSTPYPVNPAPAAPRAPPQPPLPQAIAGREIAPSLGDVKDEMLVEKRLARLTSEANPYIEQAASRAQQMANSRGMANSSLAAMAGEEAAIAAALPIAQQDANTYGRVQSENLGYTNQFNLTDKNAALQQSMQSNDINFRRELADKELAAAEANRTAASAAATAESSMRMQMLEKELGSRERLATMELDARRLDAETNRSFQERMQNAGFANQTALARMELDSRTQTNLMSMEQNTFNNWASVLGNIMTNTNMSAEDRTRAQQNWTAMFAANPYFPFRASPSAYAPPPPAPAPVTPVSPSNWDPASGASEARPLP